MLKRKRCVGFDDHIKEDGVLMMIVSKLPIREAIRTSVLSRRWRYIWNHMPNLNFTLHDISATFDSNTPRLGRYEHYILQKTPEFVHAVDAVLIQHRGSGVETFKIGFFLQKEHTPSIDKWLDFALASDTKILDLNFLGIEQPNSYLVAYLMWKWNHVPGYEPYKFQFHKLLQQKRSSSKLSTLRLGYCSLQVPSSDCNRLPFLKTIDLYCLKLSDMDFENLLSICSDIEHLSVYGCPWLVNMSIHQQSGRLKHLSVRNCTSLERLHIQVACLATFEYQGDGKIALFTDASHISKASFHFQVNLRWAKYGITDLSSHLPSCQDLTLEFDHLPRCLSAAWNNRFEHLKHLTVRVKDIHVDCVLLLFKILKAAPVLEKFELQLLNSKKLNIKDLPLEEEHLPHAYLKEVNITGFTGTRVQIGFVRSLFCNLLSLTTMRINVQHQQFIDLKLDFDAREVIFDGVLAFDYLQSVAPSHVDLVLQYPTLSESDSGMLQSLRSSTHLIHKFSFSK